MCVWCVCERACKQAVCADSQYECVCVCVCVRVSVLDGVGG